MRTIALFILFCTTGSVLAQERRVDESFRTQIDELRSVWLNMEKRELSQNVAPVLRAIKMPQRLSEKAHNGNIAAYLTLRNQFVARDVSCIPSKEWEQIYIVENLWLIMEKYGDNERDVRRLVRASIGRMSPVSLWGERLNRIHSEMRGLTNPPPATVPDVELGRSLEVSANLFRAGLFDNAWRAYTEAIYGELGPSWISSHSAKYRDNNWLSPKAAVYWAKAAECARLAGKTELGWGYLMKAAVFGDEKTYKAALKTATQWDIEDKDPTKKPKPKPIDPKVRREALTKVVRLYAKMNAHPRAWELIDAYPDAFENPKSLKKEIQDEWLVVVKGASWGAMKVVLYGQEVYPNGDPLKVKIPQAMSDEAIKKVNKQLKEFFAKETQGRSSKKN
jgi:hypothetical protein